MLHRPLQHRSRTAPAAALGVLLLVGACADPTATGPGTPFLSSGQPPKKTTVTSYDARDLADYQGKWSNPYGALSLAANGTLAVAPAGGVTVRAVPFTVGADFSVYDHLKYIGISTQAFRTPKRGSLTFSVDIAASTPGTQPGRVIHGCYGPGFSWDGVAPCARPWSAPTFEGQQAGVVLNMISFATGQLFDWFVSDHEVFALIERLPSNVTGFGTVGLERAYTQIIKVAPIEPGARHTVAITFTRGDGPSRVEYFLDGQLFARANDVGIPLDQQHAHFTGVYPSYGPGEPLGDQLDEFQIGHGLFSLLDAFPFQHPDRPDLSVSIPMSERLFGQGAEGTWSNFQVTTVEK